MAAIAAMIQCNVIASGGGRTEYLFVCEGGAFAISDYPTTPSGIGGTTIGASDIPSLCTNGKIVYVIDGNNLLECDVSFFPFGTATVAPIVASGGSSIPSNLIMGCIYRSRLVVSDGTIFYAARVDDPTDWDYTADDESAAFASNIIPAGNLGDVHTALIPQSNDNLLIGCFGSLYQVIGDPRAGGSVEMVSRSVGVYGFEAWCQDDEGSVYFAGTSGFYKIGPGGRGLKNLSAGRYGTFFEALNRGTYHVQLRYDKFRKVVYIFATKRATAASVHLVYDIRNESFISRWQHPTSMGPTSSCVFDGAGVTEYDVLYGGRDGVIRKLDVSALSDDGTAITSQVYFGPIEAAGPDESAMVVGLKVNMGETWGTVNSTDYNLTFNVLSANDPYRAWAVADQTSENITFTSSGAQDRYKIRQAGEWFWIKASNSTLAKTWNIDRIVVDVNKAGDEKGVVSP